MGDGQKRMEQIDQRLRAWAWWHWSSRVGGHYARSSWLAIRVDGGNMPPPVPISTTGEEAIETDQVVAALALPLKLAVKAAYLDREGCSMEQIAGKLRCTRTTLHNRLCEADRRIAAELYRRAQAREEAGRRDQAAAVVMRTRVPAEVD